MATATAEFIVGRLMCGVVRDLLSYAQLRYPDIRYHEGRGFIERRFTVMGNAENVRTVVIAFKGLMADINNGEGA